MKFLPKQLQRQGLTFNLSLRSVQVHTMSTRATYFLLTKNIMYTIRVLILSANIFKIVSSKSAKNEALFYRTEGKYPEYDKIYFHTFDKKKVYFPFCRSLSICPLWPAEKNWFWPVQMERSKAYIIVPATTLQIPAFWPTGVGKLRGSDPWVGPFWPEPAVRTCMFHLGTGWTGKATFLYKNVHAYCYEKVHVRLCNQRQLVFRLPSVFSRYGWQFVSRAQAKPCLLSLQIENCFY